MPHTTPATNGRDTERAQGAGKRLSVRPAIGAGVETRQRRTPPTTKSRPLRFSATQRTALGGAVRSATGRVRRRRCESTARHGADPEGGSLCMGAACIGGTTCESTDRHAGAQVRAHPWRASSTPRQIRHRSMSPGGMSSWAVAATIAATHARHTDQTAPVSLAVQARRSPQRRQWPRRSGVRSGSRCALCTVVRSGAFIAPFCPCLLRSRGSLII